MRSVVIASLAVALRLSAPAQESDPQRCGTVFDENGVPIQNALVVASGVGFNGWASSDADGKFCVKHAGRFISVRHAGFKPLVLPVPPPDDPVRLTLIRAESSVKALRACESLPNAGRGWIGGGLRIKPPRGGYRGPVSGEHDTHWYVRHGKQLLHVVDGYAWHAGLPLERLLSGSKSLEVRGWEFGDIIGLDLSGTSKDGTRWRWFGAPIAEAISYEEVTPEDADFFNRVIDSVCYNSTRGRSAATDKSH